MATTRKTLAYEVTSKGDTRAVREAGKDIEDSAKRGDRSWRAMASGGLKLGAAAIAAGATAAVGASAAVFKLARDAAELGDKYQKMSARTGVAAEDLSKLSHAANLGGTSIEAFETALTRGSRAIDEAAQGNQTYAESFDRLGIKVRNSDGSVRSSMDVLLDFSDRLQGVESHTEKAALAQEIFGRQGTQLLPVLAQGSDALREQMDEAEALGLVYSDLAANQSAQFIDAQTRLVGVWQGMKQTFALEVVPVLTAGMETLVSRSKGLKETSLDLGEAVGEVVIPAWETISKTWVIAGAAADTIRVGTNRLGEVSLGAAQAVVHLSEATLEWSGLDVTGEKVEKLRSIREGIDATRIAFQEQGRESIADLGKLGAKLSEVDAITEEWRQKLRDMRDDAEGAAGSPGSGGPGGGGSGVEAVVGAVTSLNEQLLALPAAETSYALDLLEGYMSQVNDQLDAERASEYAQALGSIGDEADDATPEVFDLAAALGELDVPPPDPPDLGGWLDDAVGFIQGDWGTGVSVAFGEVLSGDDVGSAIEAGLTASLTAGFNAVIPGLGVIAAPLVGALGSLFGDIFGGKTTAADEIAKQFGMNLDAALTEQIQRLGDQHGRDYGAAFRLSLGDVIRSGVVDTEAEVRQALGETLNLFADFDRGTISADETIDAMGDSLTELLPLMAQFGISIETLTQPGGLLSDLANRVRMGQFAAEDFLEIYEQVKASLEDPPDDDPFASWAQGVGVTWSRTAADIRREWKAAADSMGLSSSLRDKIMRQEIQRFNQDARQAFWEHFNDFDLTEQEKKEAVRAAMKARREDMREAQREEREQERRTRQLQRQLLRDLRKLFREVFGDMTHAAAAAAQDQVDYAYAVGDAYVYNAERARAAWGWGPTAPSPGGPSPAPVPSVASTTTTRRVAAGPTTGSSRLSQGVTIQIVAPAGVDRDFLRFMSRMFQDAQIAGRRSG